MDSLELANTRSFLLGHKIDPSVGFVGLLVQIFSTTHSSSSFTTTGPGNSITCLQKSSLLFSTDGFSSDAWNTEYVFVILGFS